MRPIAPHVLRCGDDNHDVEARLPADLDPALVGTVETAE